MIRWVEVVSANVRGSLIYPLILFWLLIPFTWIVSQKVLPTFLIVYEGLGNALPPMGRAFVLITRTVVMWGSTLALLAGLLLLAGMLARRNPLVRRLQDRIMLHLPIAGPFALWRGRTLTLEILAAWIESGGALHQGIWQAAAAQPNRALAAELDRAARRLEKGEDLPGPRRHAIFDGRTLWAVRAALAGSDAARTCRRLAAREAVSMELRARRNVLWLEIIGLAVMAALVSVVVIGTYTTIFETTSTTFDTGWTGGRP
jgi:type II secretory pathway component PulF